MKHQQNYKFIENIKNQLKSRYVCVWEKFAIKDAY